jgi:hypothetical protein
MKLKIVIVDLEIPPRVKKWTLRLGLPLVVLVAGGVAYADLPHPSWKDGDTLNAADLTANFQYSKGRSRAMAAFKGSSRRFRRFPPMPSWHSSCPRVLLAGRRIPRLKGGPSSVSIPPRAAG